MGCSRNESQRGCGLIRLRLVLDFAFHWIRVFVWLRYFFPSFADSIARGFPCSRICFTAFLRNSEIVKRSAYRVEASVYAVLRGKCILCYFLLALCVRL